MFHLQYKLLNMNKRIGLVWLRFNKNTFYLDEMKENGNLIF